MEDDYIDEDGTIWIWKLLSRPAYPVSDRRHMPREMRDRLIQHRLAQMQREAAHTIALL